MDTVRHVVALIAVVVLAGGAFWYFDRRGRK
jgi:hypothetical protein